MIELRAQISLKRYARIFARAVPIDLAAVRKHVRETFFDEEDLRRAIVLRQVLKAPRLTLHPLWGVDPSDVAHVYLSDGKTDARLFACAVLPRSQVETMLDENGYPYVAESFSTQVADESITNDDGMKRSILVWIRRCFPGIPHPELTIAFPDD